MSHSKSIPCYVPNGGAHCIINIPMGQFVRLRLKSLSRRLLDSYQHFGTMLAIQPEVGDIKLLNALVEILSLNLKPTASRRAAAALLAAHEKNLKPFKRLDGKDELCNLVQFSLSVGLIAILFMIASHLCYLEAMNY